MIHFRSVVFSLGIILCLAWTIHGQCSEIRERNGTITDSTRAGNNQNYKKCWKIHVPSDKFIQLKVGSLSLGSQSCNAAYLRIVINATNENYNFCESDVNKHPVKSLTSVGVEFYFHGTKNYYTISFSLSYEIRDLECIRENSFKCNSLSCIPIPQVCDGVINCENGADEVGCKTGIPSIHGIQEAKRHAIYWLKSKRTPSWGWNDNTPRAVTALFLANDVNFNGTSLEEELMAKQTQLKTALEMLKKPTNEKLSILINALLVTCHNPRQFYGQNLIEYLKTQLKSSSQNTPHPSVYLALCNANETWPHIAASHFEKILGSTSEYPFLKDIQAFAVMALACSTNNSKIMNKSINSYLTTLYHKTVKQFKRRQMSDGSFGNLHTTALVTQALFASGQEHAADWKLNSTIAFLMKELNSSSIDFLSVYLTLPILNGKSLSDISRIDCSSNPRKYGYDDDNFESEIQEYTGPKIRVQYSLYIGNERDIIHTIYLRVPLDSSAYEVMKMAAVEDPKYKFEWKSVSGRMYIYTIGKMTNDPESGQFWLTYLVPRVDSTNSTEISHNEIISSPENVTLYDGDHLIMWYKYAELLLA